MEYAVSLTVNVIVNSDSEAAAVQQAVNLVEKHDCVYVVGINSIQLNDYMLDA
jgi:hypothetical protein